MATLTQLLTWAEQNAPTLANQWKNADVPANAARIMGQIQAASGMTLDEAVPLGTDSLGPQYLVNGRPMYQTSVPGQWTGMGLNTPETQFGGNTYVDAQNLDQSIAAAGLNTDSQWNPNALVAGMMGAGIGLGALNAGVLGGGAAGGSGAGSFGNAGLGTFGAGGEAVGGLTASDIAALQAAGGAGEAGMASIGVPGGWEASGLGSLAGTPGAGATITGGGSLLGGLPTNIPPGASQLAQSALDAEDASQGQSMTQAANQGGGPGINSPLTTGGAAGAPAGALEWLSNLTGVPPGALSALGTGLQGVGGILAGLQQSNATNQLGNRILDMGSPSLARYEASFQPGFNIWDQPNYKAGLDTSWDTALRRLSTQGNPFGNPGGLIEANKNIMGSLGLPALQNYREMNRAAGFANVPQYAQIAQNAIGQQGGAWEAGSAALRDLTRPAPRYTLAGLGNNYMTLP